MDAARPVIVTPLEHERRALERSGLARRAQLACCGPGAPATRRWVTLASFEPGTTVILAGLAGGLDDDAAPGTAHLVGAVVDPDGHRWTPPLGGTTVVVTSPLVVTTPAQKRQLGREHGAALVDLESSAFAAAAESRGWRWGIVRGVSDGPEDRLPLAIGAWVDERGRARPARVCLALVRRPGDLASVTRLARRSRAAMAEVARVLDETLADG